MEYIKLEKIINRINRLYGNNPFKICKQKDILLQFIDMPSALKGYTTTKYRIKIIFLNTKNTEFENEFTCLHELGHIFLKHNDNILFNQTCTLHNGIKEELEADLFAISMILKKYTLDDFKGLSIKQISSLTGIDVINLEKYFQSTYNPSI